MSHYDETRNRFNPENRFIGDIENGLRYPFACYTKEESDTKYAPISTSTDLTALTAVVATKAAQSDLTALSGVVDTKASQSDLNTLSGVVDTKASQADLTTLEGTVSDLTTTVSSKASQSDLNTLSGTVSSKADESECVAIRARLDALEYVPIQITSLTASPNLCELGSSNTISIAWTLNKAATSEELNGDTITGNTKQYTSVVSNTSYNLEVTDGTTIDDKTVNVDFANQIYYGVAANLDNVTALSKVLSNDIERTITVTAGSGQYIVYAIPSRLGNAVFYVGGFEGGFDAPITQTLTNASGYQETYKVYKSTNANLGEITIEIKEG